MICEFHFRLNKETGEPLKNVTFCKDVTKIENYSKAVLDTTQVWDCHHRRETHYLKDGEWIRRDEDLTYQQLIDEGVYFDVPPSELIFLTRDEHNLLHNRGKNQSKKVLCVETGEIFESVREASKKTGISIGSISMVCNGKRGIACGYHWKFYEPINNV